MLFALCLTCSQNSESSIERISEAFTQSGMAILGFDFIGSGQNKDDFADTNFSSNLSDLKEAYDFLKKHYEVPKIILGYSLGGAAVLHLSGQLPEVKGVATIGAPSGSTHIFYLLENGRKKLEEQGDAGVNIGERLFKVKKQFLDDLESRNTKEAIKNLGKALLILHSPQDTIIGIENAQEIYMQASHPKNVVSLDGADHLLTKEIDVKYVGSIIACWANRYLDANKPDEMPEGEVKTRIGNERFTTEVVAGRHRLLADEPLSFGGADHGPTPYGYLLSALGTCTAMTMRMFADNKKMDIKEVEVTLTHHRIYKEDADHSAGLKRKIDQIKTQKI
ncbi:MAG: alpha/beta fold hydrolase [Bacteroidota bacterium]